MAGWVLAQSFLCVPWCLSENSAEAASRAATEESPRSEAEWGTLRQLGHAAEHLHRRCAVAQVQVLPGVPLHRAEGCYARSPVRCFRIGSYRETGVDWQWLPTAA